MQTPAVHWSFALLFAGALLGCGGGSGSDEAPAPAPVVTEPPPSPPPPAPPAPLALPSMAIDTSNVTILRSDYIIGSYTITTSAGAMVHSGPMEIRGRGNSTWGLDKKPYRIRLETSADLLGMPGNRNWVLLANHADKTLLRNDITFEVGRLLGMAWTPRSRDVHVSLNGRYDGVYQLTEHIRIDEQRVDIDEIDAADVTEPAISGGYLLEVDARSSTGSQCFNTARAGMTFCGDDPGPFDASLQPQRDYISGYIRDTEDALFGPAFTDSLSGYGAWLDVDSAIQYYLANELVKNVDGNLRLSTYMYKKRGGKLFFGPLWDFDLALGNATYDGADSAEGWYIRTAPWFARMFEDPAFNSRVAQQWRDMKSSGKLDALVAYVDRRLIELGDAQVRNFTRWPIMDTKVYANVVWPFPNSYANEASYMRGFLVARIAWMDAQFAAP